MWVFEFFKQIGKVHLVGPPPILLSSDLSCIHNFSSCHIPRVAQTERVLQAIAPFSETIDDDSGSSRRCFSSYGGKVRERSTNRQFGMSLPHSDRVHGALKSFQ